MAHVTSPRPTSLSTWSTRPADVLTRAARSRRPAPATPHAGTPRCGARRDRGAARAAAAGRSSIDQGGSGCAAPDPRTGLFHRRGLRRSRGGGLPLPVPPSTLRRGGSLSRSPEGDREAARSVLDRETGGGTPAEADGTTTKEECPKGGAGRSPAPLHPLLAPVTFQCPNHPGGSHHRGLSQQVQAVPSLTRGTSAPRSHAVVMSRSRLTALA